MDLETKISLSFDPLKTSLICQILTVLPSPSNVYRSSVSMQLTRWSVIVVRGGQYRRNNNQLRRGDDEKESSGRKRHPTLKVKGHVGFWCDSTDAQVLGRKQTFAARLALSLDSMILSREILGSKWVTGSTVGEFERRGAR